MRILLLILTVFLGMGPLVAQEQEKPEGSASWRRANILRELVYSSGRRGQLLALDRLAAMADQGELAGDDAELIAVLTSLATQGSYIKKYDKNLNLVNDHMMIRAAAVKVLGKIGGPLVSVQLVDLLNNEEESLVVSVAMKAFQQVAKEDPYSLDALVRGFMRMHYQYRDNTVANTYLDVITDITEKNRQLLGPDAIYSVQRIAWDGSGYTAPVRNKALSLILDWI